MRNGYPSLSLCLKRLRSLVGALLLALGALGVEAQAAPSDQLDFTGKRHGHDAGDDHGEELRVEPGIGAG